MCGCAIVRGSKIVPTFLSILSVESTECLFRSLNMAHKVPFPKRNCELFNALFSTFKTRGENFPRLGGVGVVARAFTLSGQTRENASEMSNNSRVCVSDMDSFLFSAGGPEIQPTGK
uniref:(northern house mosquito) hypothetical protein n=1 Tax=Culex pipiens TaxID=7175 RepID=A0A8D8F1N7_CULPI